MTLPYPDSPVVTENIGTSITRIKDNMEYLDGLIGSLNNIKLVVSTGANLSTKTSTQLITGVGFQPRAMIVMATYRSLHMNSYGAATQYSSGTSVDCGCVAQAYNYAGTYSLACVQLFQSNSVYIKGSVSAFTADGVGITWTNNGSATGSVGDIMYIFFG